MTTSSDLTFFTNEPGRILRDRFRTLLGKTNAFDCLVGYFFVSGFYKLYPDLEHVEKIRVLVGLQTDRVVYEFLQQARDQAVLPLPSHAATQEQAADAVRNELESADDTAEVEAGVHTFVDWLRSGKLDIKAYPAGNLHAKVYIMTLVEGELDTGRVITGSSNLTQAGLQDNLEFNVELKNAADYDFALAKFNALWAEAVEVSEPYADVIQNQSPYAAFTPYELYLKFLYEYFRAELNRPTELDDMYVPEGFMKLKYQEEAVINARKVLDEYGGCFLADVVGLGKTYMAALLAQQLDGRTLVIAPPTLLDRDKKGSWPNVFSDFRVSADFESSGKLEHLLARDLSRYKNVFIDESHRFRNEGTRSYAALAEICRGKRVILVSATPLNNDPGDILSQVKLFQNGKASTLPNLRNLEAFFARLRKNLSGLDRQLDRERYFETVQANAKATRDNVLKYLMIRRTRTEIARYYAGDLEKQGLKFPDVQDPEPLFYQFNAQENAIFEETLRLLTREFTYARYRPLTYYTGPRPEQERQGQRNLARFMKILMIKRLESSFHAFRLTLGRFARSYQRAIAEFEKGHVYLSKDHSAKLLEALEADDVETVERLLEEEKAERLDAADFKPEFLLDLRHDAGILREVQQLWAQVTRDPKWEAFRTVLTTQPRLQQGKLIIFTESRETAEYLGERIAAEVDPRAIVYSAQAGEAAHRAVIDNFDANAFRPRDDDRPGGFRILVSTEVLAEGVNLHRANIVINYDIPWNPTRLIQRVGRVNRVDTAFDTIHTYNFFPTTESNDAIKLKEAAEAKIHAFIEMLGADARLLTEGEELKSHDLFARLNSRRTITGEDEAEESELAYLTEIRTVRDTQPDLFTRIKRLPKKARSTRVLAPGGVVPAFPALLTYFRQGQLDKFYLITPEITTPQQLDFLTTAKLLRPADPDELRQAIGGDFYTLLERNKEAFVAVTSTADDDVKLGGSRNPYIINRLKAREIRRYHGFTEDDEAYIQDVIGLLADGALPKAITTRLAAALKKESAPLKVLGILRRNIPVHFFQPTQAAQTAQAQHPREVILSSYLLEA